MRSTYSDHIKRPKVTKMLSKDEIKILKTCVVAIDYNDQLKQKYFKKRSSKSLDFALIPDKIYPKKLKESLKNTKIPANRFFDNKTRTIINLENKKDENYLYLDQIHF